MPRNANCVAVDSDERATDDPYGDIPFNAAEHGMTKNDHKVGCLHGMRRDFCDYISGLIFWILFLLFFINFYLSPGLIVEIEYAPWWVFFIPYGLYIIDGVSCPTFRYLYNLRETNKAHEHLDAMHAADPRVDWHIQCYHYEERTETKTDSDGNTTTETKRERVDTHSASGAYRYSKCTDQSNKIEVDGDFARNPFTKLACELKLILDAGYGMQKYIFITTNDRDTHYDFDEYRTLPGMITFMLVLNNKKDKPCWMNLFVYLLCLLLGLGLIYRWCLSGITDKIVHEYVKKLDTDSEQVAITVAEATDGSQEIRSDIEADIEGSDLDFSKGDSML